MIINRMADDYNNLDAIPLSPPSMPYQNLALKVDPSLLEGTKFVFEGEETKKRSLGDIMFYGIGTSYMSGLAAGGIWGLAEHLRTYEGSSSVVRRNHLLNSMTKRGTFVGNSLGVLALLFTASSGLIGKFARDGKDDILNDITGGAVTGAFYKSTKRRLILPFMIGGAVTGFMINVISTSMNEGVTKVPVVFKESLEDTYNLLTSKD